MIDLLVFAQDETPASFAGRIIGMTTDAKEIARLVDDWYATTTADALLLWDPRLGTPPNALCEQLVRGRGDLWHAGLLLGAAGHPGLLDFVMPTWMLNRDPDPAIEATSWRASPHALLVRRELVRDLGGPSASFDSASAAVLEWGLRAVQLGAMTRHVPALVQERARALVMSPSLTDQLRIIAARYTRRWTRWAMMRAVLDGYASAPELARAYAELGDTTQRSQMPFRTTRAVARPSPTQVSVLIPTVDRYPYLRVVLENLRSQTVRPLEIILVDQTEKDHRDHDLAREFADLPLTILYRDEPGQSGARNEGLAHSTGDHILFLDDDIEFGPTLIADHLASLARYGADVSSGSVYEPGASPPDPITSYARISEVFPTGNTLVKRDVLVRSGLFDLAFDRAPRADGELGMRVYLSGALMVLDPRITMLHHRAPSGGLRKHGARVATYGTSRQQLTRRHLPHVSEIYLASRHFTQRQVHEVLWLRALGTLSGRGSRLRRLAKLVIGTAQLPDTIRQTIERRKQARSWLTRFPQIAQLPAHTLNVTSRPTR